MPISHNSDSLVTRNLTVEDALTLGDATAIELRQMAAPLTPPTGSLLVYAKSDGKLYTKNDAGTETELSATPTRHRTTTRTLYVEYPKATDAFPIGYVADASTMVAVRAVSDVGTVTFNVEKRNKLTPGMAGTDVWTTDKQATAAGLEQTTFDGGTVAADQWLYFAASAVASSPTKLWVSVEYTID
ncbi:MAG: hypothetical protein AABZ12_03750 [Planctomycetota bacterium]